MDKYLKRTFFYIAFAILCGILGALVAHIVRKHFAKEEPNTIEVIRCDTIRIETPVAVHDTILKHVSAKLPKAQQDAKEPHIPLNPKIEEDTPTKIADSVEVIIPITQKEYCDTNYRAWVSGYMASLDSIRVYSRTITSTKVKQPKWGVGVGVGASIGRSIEPCVFVGVTYTIKTF